MITHLPSPLPTQTNQIDDFIMSPLEYSHHYSFADLLIKTSMLTRFKKFLEI